MKASFLLILTLFTISAYAQLPLNAYKYVFVPERFAFSREDNQYGLAALTKLQLEQKGFVVFRDKDALPPALAANRCSALKVEVTERKTLFSTNLTLYLKDCQGNTIFKSKEGKSREKEFEQAYPLALSDAFASLYATPYIYDSTLTAQNPQTTQPAQPVQQAPVAAAATSSTQAPIPAAPPAADLNGTLYAQPIPNGYQLVDTSPKKVLTLLKTSAQDYFIADAGTFAGIAFKKDGVWFFEYYKNDKLVSQKLEIKF
jgi:hypothetical protein